MKFFMLGSMCGGVAVSFVSAVLLRDTDSAFWQLCIGYAAAACVSGLIYGAALRVMAFALRRVTQDDAWRGLAMGAITTAAQYAASTLIGNHDSDRTLLIVAPLCAAGIDAFRARRRSFVLADSDLDLPVEPPVVEPPAVEPGPNEHAE